MRLLHFIFAVALLGHCNAWGSSSPDFLIPGADFTRLSFEVGAWCRYYVSDEALGVTDSSEIYLGVTGRETTPRGVAYWVEMETRPRGGSQADARLLKLLVLERINAFSEGDSLGEFVLRLYSKNGDHPTEEEDPKAYKGFSQVIPTTDSTWVSTPGVPAGTAAGEFLCTMKHQLINNDREVETGGVRLIRESRDDFTVWFCDEVPVFHLARCEIIRRRRTDTQPRISGIPPSSRKDSRTTAELVAFGFDAKPLLDLPQK